MQGGFAQVLTFPATLPPGARLLEGGRGEVPRACPSALSLTPGLCAERKARRPQGVSPGSAWSRLPSATSSPRDPTQGPGL